MKLFKSPFLLVFIVFLCVTAIILFYIGPEMVQRRYFYLPEAKRGPMGDAFAGTIGPLIAWIAALLTFAAFWVQYQANQQQKIQFSNQANDTTIERFESNFYSLIELHRNNITEITNGEAVSGRKGFIYMFNELKFIYLTVDSFYKHKYSTTPGASVIPKEIIYNIAYLIFFFGIGPNSSPIITDLIGEKYHSFFREIEKELKNKQELWRSNRGTNLDMEVAYEKGIFILDIPYLLCNGHMAMLSHYLRNLFQMFKYIHEQKEEVFSYEQKFQYAGTLRSQLSTHEQLLIYYNSVSVLGGPWVTEGLMKEYCIIKTIPLTLADFYKSPLEIFGSRNDKDKVMFEWDNIKRRLNEQD